MPEQDAAPDRPPPLVDRQTARRPLRLAFYGSIAVAVAAVLAVGATAPARDVRLRPASSLDAVTARAATGPVVRLRWRDRARGETRWEVLRRPRSSARRRKAVLKTNSTRFTDRRVRAGRSYRYLVRPCRRARCAKAASVRVSVRRSVASPRHPETAPPIPATPAPDPAPPPRDPFEGSPRIGDCPVFPKDNAWNVDISGFPVDRMSDAYIRSLGDTTLWPSFGSGAHGDYGIPYAIVPFGQPLVPIRFHGGSVAAAESDPGPYPIPPGARVEEAADPGADHHVLILRQGDCRLFELYDAVKRPDNGWSVYSAATFDLRSNAVRPEGHTSADAAGLPILPGLAKVEEVQAGAIQHALRVAVPRTQAAYIHPARHFASNSTDPALPPMGLRLRLKSSYDVSGMSGQARVIARALQVYGALVADNSSGGRVFISGTPDLRWDDRDLNQLKSIPASALEAVWTGVVRGR